MTTNYDRGAYTMYDEENGPSLTKDHVDNYVELLANYKVGPECNGSVDYFLVGLVNGIEYYAPNDEQWGTIIAVDHENTLACDTDFYEMDDIKADHGEYAFKAVNGKLVPGFEL